MKKSGTQTVQNSGPFRRTFGVGIRAANALPMSILTLAALLLALTLLSAGAPPASAQVDTAATEVEVFENWSLKPMGVMDVGDKFRLLIVTSTALNASTTVMDSYNGIIRDSVAAGHTDIRPYSHLSRIHRWTRTEGVRTLEGGVRKLQTRWPGLEFG